MSKLIKSSIILILIFNVFSIGALTVSAAEGLLPDTQSGTGGACPAGTDNCGNYSLNDILSVVLKISELILGLVGALALAAFIAGGLMWILSAGSAEWVTKGKQTIIGAVIGLVIVFTSFMIIQLVFTALGIPNTSSGQWSISSWTSSWR